MAKEGRISECQKNVTTTMSILHITTKLVKTPTNNLTTLIYSLVNGLYKITTASIKLILDAEQSGASSNLNIPTCNVQKVSDFSFFSSSSTHPR